MKTQLIEFQNAKKATLRGILLKPENKSSKGVIFVSGFERNGTTEPKFKDLADRLSKEGIPSMRFDFSGAGLSDGEFKHTTIDNWTAEFSNAYDTFKSQTGIKSVYVVAHSMGCAVIGRYLDQNPESVERAVLIAPALNQRDLMRYWFVTGKMKKEQPDLKITWDNYTKFLSEKEFQVDSERTDKMSKYNFINAEYFMGSGKIDLSDSFENYRNEFLHVHGDNDPAVPIDSLNVDFTNKVIVEGGDHDMEKPNQRTQWISKAVKYLAK